MASFIPRFEWNDITVNGDTTSGSPTISGIADTSAVVVGMIIDSTRFPANATVLSKTSSTVTISRNATATVADTDFAFFERLDMDYPCPTEDGEETYKVVNQVSESVSGVRQVQTNSIQALLDLNFTFMSSTTKTKLKDRWFLTWAAYYKEFRFFPSYEISSFKTYEMDQPTCEPERTHPKAGDFLYKVKLKFRRVL